MKMIWLTLETCGGTHAVLIVETGRKWTRVVAITDAGVRVFAVPKAVAAKAGDIMFRNKPYPVRRAALRLLRAGAALGITDGARKHLVRAIEENKA